MGGKGWPSPSPGGPSTAVGGRSLIGRFGARAWRRDLFFWEFSALAWLLFLPYIMTAHGHLDWSRHALGRDFVNYWTAAHLMFGPHRLDIFDPPLFLGWEHRLFDPRLPFHFWSYPPPALLVIAPLAIFSYIPGLIAWSAAGVAALIPAARTFFAENRDRRLMLAAPAVAVNIALGQNGALTGALLLSGLALWDRRPRVAGLLLGLLVFKPQLAILLPVAVLANRRWSVMMFAGLSGTAVLAVSTLAFGWEAWRGFLGPTLAMQGVMLSQGQGPFQWMMTSVFMAGRVSGLSSSTAMALQVPFALFAAALVWRAYRGDGSVQDRAAMLIIATFLASPQGFNYDLIPAAAAGLYLLRRDPTAIGLILALLLWTLPVLLLAAEVIHIAVAPAVLLIAAVRLATLPAPPSAQWPIDTDQSASKGKLERV